MRWEHFDLDAGTYVGRRAKTSIVRVMCLWPETIRALKSLPRKGPWVFPSTTGIRYQSIALYHTYKVMKDEAGITTPFSGLRDAAYTLACEKCSEQIARVFASLKSGGLLDSYVQHRPEFVRPAADAIHAAFAPFPAPVNHPSAIPA